MLSKRLLPIFSILSIPIQQIAAQEYKPGLYIKPSIEYSMPIMGTKGFSGNTDFSINSPSAGGQYVVTGSTIKKTSFGNGLWASLHIGYFFTNNFGVDMGIQMGIQQGNKEYTYTLVDHYVSNRIDTKANRPILLNPSAIYRTPINDKFTFQGKAGVVLPFRTTIMQEEYRYPNTNLTSKITNRFAFGFSCGLGTEYKVSQHFAVSAETNMIALSTDTKRREITSFEVDGKELINEVPDNIRITNYEYDVKYTGSSSNIAEPISIPFSRLGIKLGVAYYF